MKKIDQISGALLNLHAKKNLYLKFNNNNFFFVINNIIIYSLIFLFLFSYLIFKYFF